MFFKVFSFNFQYSKYQQIKIIQVLIGDLKRHDMKVYKDVMNWIKTYQGQNCYILVIGNQF